jgi:hypothetical protein
MWNPAFFSLPSETKFSLQFQISLPKRKWGRTLTSTFHAFSFHRNVSLLLLEYNTVFKKASLLTYRMSYIVPSLLRQAYVPVL